MAHKNQAVLDMIEQVRARLVDLEEDVLAFDGDLTELAEKIDRVDDKLYLLELDIAKRAEASSDDAEAGEGESEESPAAVSDDDADDDNGMNILTPEAKEKIGETVGDMREIGREAAETFTELNEAFSDITAPFKTLTGRGRRR